MMNQPMSFASGFSYTTEAAPPSDRLPRRLWDAFRSFYTSERPARDDREALRDAFEDAQLELGMKMFRLGIDDGETGAQLSAVETKLRKGVTPAVAADLWSQRERLLRTLADAALEDDAPLPGADREFAAAREARAALAAPPLAAV